MLPPLRSRPFDAGTLLVTGATGYLGALVVASLLRDTAARIVCLTRAVHDRPALLQPIVEEWEAQSKGCWSDAVDSRVVHLHLPADLADLSDLAPQLAGVDEIVHCAGCLDYHDAATLQAVNVGFTAHLLVLARRLELTRFVYISTAYSAGYQPHAVAEGALPDPPADPTAYTRTKREAERLVAASGVPFVVIRPSILIGSSDTGRYSGKRYGLYQQWMGLERLVCDRYHADFHTVAPERPLNLLHQDAFCEAFKAAHRWLPDGAYMNLVSDGQQAPSMRDLWEMWFEVTRPERIHYYRRLDDVPLKSIPLRQRAYLTFAQINLEIAAHHWRFDGGWLARLRERGLAFVDADAGSVRICQDRFVRSSALMQRYLIEHNERLADRPQVIEMPLCAATPAAALLASV